VAQVSEFRVEGYEARVGALDAHLFPDVDLLDGVAAAAAAGCTPAPDAPVGTGVGRVPGAGVLGLCAAVASGAVAENGVHLVVLEAADGADSKAELGAEVDGRAGGLEGAEVQDDAALLQAEVDAEVVRAGAGRGEVVRRAGRGEPGGRVWGWLRRGAGAVTGVGGGRDGKLLRALEQGGGGGEGVGEQGEGGGQVGGVDGWG